MTTTDVPSAIILAAGRSRRMGEWNKLLLEVNGRPVLARVLDAFVESKVGEILVVTGAEHERVSALVRRADRARTVHNSNFSSGMASSIRRGIRAAAPETSGYALCPGDLPLLTSDILDHLFDTFVEQTSPRIVAPTYDGQQGHPVLFGRSFRNALLDLEGDRGARRLLQSEEATVSSVPVEDDGILQDVDTPEALEEVRQRVQREGVRKPGL